MYLKHTYLTEFKVITIFLKLLGWLPCSRVETNLGVVLILKPFSIDFCYSVVMITLQFSIAIYMLLDGIKIVPNMPSHLHVTCYYMMLYKIVPHFFPLLTAIQAPNQVKFIKKWLNVQHEIETVGISGTPYNFGVAKRKLLLKLAVILFLCAVAMTGRAWRLQRMTLQDFFLILGIFNEGLLYLWFDYTARIFKILSNRLIEEYQLLLEYNEAGNSGELLAKAVLNLRSPSLKLSNIRKSSGSLISISQGLHFINSFTRLLWAAYLTNAVMDYRILGIGGLVFFSSVFELYSTCNASHEARKKWHDDLLIALACTKRLRINNATKDTMTVFLLHLIHNSPEITFGGYINVGRSLLSTLFSAFITYSVVILQFKAYEKINVTFEDVLNISDHFYSMKKN